MPRSTGLEITASSFRAVVADGSVKGWRVLSFHEAPVPPPAEGQDPKAAFAEALAKFITEKKLPRGIVVPSLEAATATVREVALPFGTDDHLRKTVKFELESHTHNIEIEDVVVDFVKVDQKEKQTYLMAFAAAKKLIRERLDALTAARIDPPSIDLDATAVLNAYLCGPAAELAGAFLALHVGRTGSYLFFVSGGLKLLRVLPLSSSEDGFENKAAAEVCRTLLSVSSGKDLPEVLISGDADNLPELASTVGREAGVTARVVNLFEKSDIAEDVENAHRRGGVALGLALKGLGVDKVGLDFRREEFTYERKTDALKRAAAALLALVNVFFILAIVKCWDDRKEVQKHHTDLLTLEQKMFTELFPGEPKPKDPVAVLKSRKDAEIEQKGGGGHPIPKSALEMWADLFGQIKVQNKFFIDTMSVIATPGQGSIKMNGRMDPPDEAERILQAVRQVKAFANAKPPAVTQEKTMWRYDIDIPVSTEGAP